MRQPQPLEPADEAESKLLARRPRTAHQAPPQDRIGLSKLARVVDFPSRRAQTQERLTRQVAEHLEPRLSRRGVGVAIEHQASRAEFLALPRTHMEA